MLLCSTPPGRPALGLLLELEPQWSGETELATALQLLGRVIATYPRAFDLVLADALYKEQLLWVRTFRTVEELRQALAEFRERYNQCWIVQRHGYLTPQQARQQLLAQEAAA